jgi:integrase
MPRNRGPRVRVATGIYRDARGYSACVQVGTAPRARTQEKRFQLGANFADIRDWMATARRTLRLQVPLRRAAQGTLAGDVAAYLVTIAAMPSWVSRRSDLRAWLPPFGDRCRHTLTAAELNQQLHAWREAGVAAATCNHRRRALVALYEALDGPLGPNTARATDAMRPPALEARDIDATTRRQLLRAMYPGKARAMWGVMSETGLPPARIRLLRAEDVDLEARAVFVLGRRKGHGTASRTLPLTAAGVRAFAEYAKQSAFATMDPETGALRPGGVARATLFLVFSRALEALNTVRSRAALPPLQLRPYDARHAFGAAVYRQTGDIRAAAELLDVSLETAMRYTMGAVPDRLRTVVATLDGDGARRGGHARMRHGERSRHKVGDVREGRKAVGRAAPAYGTRRKPANKLDGK